LNFDVLNELNFQTLLLFSIMQTKTFCRALCQASRNWEASTPLLLSKLLAWISG